MANKSHAKTVSSREFNQAASRLKKATEKGPVFITDRGRTSHVLLSIEEYERITGRPQSILDMLYDERVSAIDFEPPLLSGSFIRPADFS